MHRILCNIKRYLPGRVDISTIESGEGHGWAQSEKKDVFHSTVPVKVKKSMPNLGNRSLTFSSLVDFLRLSRARQEPKAKFRGGGEEK